jgi:hypothetical protein
MLQAFQVLTVLFVAVAMALALAHALELPGKLRLSRDTYLAVQRMYYPGFTIGGAVEAAALVCTALLVFLSRTDATVFWLTLMSFLALLAMHAVYWVVTHPVNNFWMRGFQPKGVGGRFFAFGTNGRHRKAYTPEWTELRDQWEYSHVARAVLGVLSLTLLVSAVAL